MENTRSFLFTCFTLAVLFLAGFYGLCTIETPVTDAVRIALFYCRYLCLMPGLFCLFVVLYVLRNNNNPIRR